MYKMPIGVIMRELLRTISNRIRGLKVARNNLTEVSPSCHPMSQLFRSNEAHIIILTDDEHIKTFEDASQ